MIAIGDHGSLEEPLPIANDCDDWHVRLPRSLWCRDRLDEIAYHPPEDLLTRGLTASNPCRLKAPQTPLRDAARDRNNSRSRSFAEFASSSRKNTDRKQCSPTVRRSSMTAPHRRPQDRKSTRRTPFSDHAIRIANQGRSTPTLSSFIKSRAGLSDILRSNRQSPTSAARRS